MIGETRGRHMGMASIRLLVAGDEREVRCEHCGRQFKVRPVEVVGDNSLRGTERAKEKAVAHGETVLAKRTPIRPCPGCGGFQADMLVQYRKDRQGMAIGFGVLVTLGLMALPVTIYFKGAKGGASQTDHLFWVALVCLAVGLTASAVMYVVLPRTDPAKDKRLAADLEEFDQALASTAKARKR